MYDLRTSSCIPETPLRCSIRMRRNSCWNRQSVGIDCSFAVTSRSSTVRFLAAAPWLPDRSIRNTPTERRPCDGAEYHGSRRCDQSKGEKQRVLHIIACCVWVIFDEQVPPFSELTIMSQHTLFAQPTPSLATIVNAASRTMILLFMLRLLGLTGHHLRWISKNKSGPSARTLPGLRSPRAPDPAETDLLGGC